MPINMNRLTMQLKVAPKETPATREGMGFKFERSAAGLYQVYMYRNGSFYDGYVTPKYNEVKTYFRKRYGIGVPLRKELEFAKAKNGTRFVNMHREHEGAFVKGE